MSEPFVGQIQLFGFNFAPVGWALCSGQILPISQNTALFSLLGTQFGGDGKATFGLPNLNAGVAMGQGAGPGLTQRVMGETGGEAAVTLTAQTLPSHTHTFSATNAPGTTGTPAGNQLATVSHASGRVTAQGAIYATVPGSPNLVTSPALLAQSGGGQPHNNLQPYLVLNYCIALQGVFPARA